MRTNNLVIYGDFSLISVAERLTWRDALSRHLLSQMRTANGHPLSKWKIDEQVVPMNLAVAGLLSQGVVDPLTIEKHFLSENQERVCEQQVN